VFFPPLPITLYPLPSIIALFLFFTLAPLPFTLHPLPSVLAADWQATVTFSVADPIGGRAVQPLTAGMRVTALDGFDNTWDAIAMKGNTLAAYFYHPGDTGHEFLARDVRFSSYPKQWDLYVDSDQDGQPVMMGWSLPQTAMGACLGIALTMTDVTAGAPVDLTQAGYTYANSAGVSRRFQLTASQVVETPPQQPVNLFSPRVGASSVLLAWTGTANPAVVGYHIYRKDPGSTGYKRRTVAPAPTAKYIDTDVAPGDYFYLVTSTSATGCESNPSNALAVKVGQ
jgi:hypothetical protein